MTETSAKPANSAHGTVDEAEIRHFSALADQWWDEKGKFRTLHKFNPVRLQFLRDEICRHFGRQANRSDSMAGLSVVDIGCGGGLLSEPFARMGASVTGIDASARNIEVARIHAGRVGLSIDYRATTAEALAESGARFDVGLAMEVIEHVADIDLFLDSCARLVKPGGLLFVATLNRTLRAYALAIVGAEYILGWLPRGTHDWNKFIRPDELTAGFRKVGLRPGAESGVVYDPLSDRWRVSKDMAVNYMIAADKPVRPA